VAQMRNLQTQTAANTPARALRQNMALQVAAEQGTSAGTEDVDFPVQFNWNSEITCTHTFCLPKRLVNYHRFKSKSGKSPEHINMLCLCTAEHGQPQAEHAHIRY